MMKKIFVLLQALFIIFIISCCHKKITTQQNKVKQTDPVLKENNPDDNYREFEAYYYHTTTSTYEKAEIKNAKLTFTYFKDAKGDCSQQIKQIPCWTEADLKTKEAELTRDDIDSLIRKIEQSGFWSLDTVIGNPAEVEHYYSFILSYKAAKKRKSVLFKSVPGCVGMPNAFRKARDELMVLARKKT